MGHRGPHAFNREFRWPTPGRPFRTLTAEQIAQYDRDGFFVFPAAFSAAEVAELRREIDPYQDQISRMLGRRAEKPGYTISSNLVLRSERLRQFCATGPLAAIAHDLLDDRPRLYWEQAVYKRREHSRAFGWHQDNGKLFLEPQAYPTCWVALTDATPENGCVWVTPGLHRLGTLEHWQSAEGWVCLEDAGRDRERAATPIPLRAGDVAVFSSVTVHMTGPNHTDQTRKAYVVQYAPGSARSIERSPATGELVRTPQDAEGRQFLVHG